MDIFVTAPGSYFNSLAQIFLWAMFFLFHMLQGFFKNELISAKGKREGKIHVIYFCFKSLACPKLVLARAYLKGELLRRQFFPILMIFPAITELVNCILKILLYHDCMPFGKLLHMEGQCYQKKNILTFTDNKRAFVTFIFVVAIG